MTETDPSTPAGEPPPTPPIVASARTFSVGGLIGGLVLSICIGGVGNIFSGLFGMSTNSKPLALLIGIIPGVFFALMSLLAPKNGFSQGLLIGGCIVALVGGACGVSMVGTSFH